MRIPVAPLLADVAKMRAKIKSDAEVMERMRLKQVKLEEQLKAEVEKNVTLTAKKRTLEETLASKEEIIKVLTSGTERADAGCQTHK